MPPAARPRAGGERVLHRAAQASLRLRCVVDWRDPRDYETKHVNPFPESTLPDFRASLPENRKVSGMRRDTRGIRGWNPNWNAFARRWRISPLPPPITGW